MSERRGPSSVGPGARGVGERGCLLREGKWFYNGNGGAGLGLPALPCPWNKDKPLIEHKMQFHAERAGRGPAWRWAGGRGEGRHPAGGCTASASPCNELVSGATLFIHVHINNIMHYAPTGGLYLITPRDLYWCTLAWRGVAWRGG